MVISFALTVALVFIKNSISRSDINSFATTSVDNTVYVICCYDHKN